MDEKLINRICMVLSVVLAVVLCLIVVHHRQAGATSAGLPAEAEVEQQQAIMETERLTLEDELEELLLKYDLVEKSILPAVEFIVTDLDESLYTDLYPMMQEHGYVGKLVLTHKQFPDGDGKITIDEFEELMDAGWSYCIGWDSDTDLADRIDTMAIRMERYSLEMPQTVFDRDALYTNEMAEILKERGFDTLIVNRTKNLKVDEPKKKKGIWIYNAQTTDAFDVPAALAEHAENGGGCFCLRLRMKDGSKTVFDSEKTEELFSQIDNLVQEERLYLCQTGSMLDYWSNAQALRESQVAELDEAKAMLEAQLAEVEAE